MDKTKVQSGKEKKEYNKGTYVIGKIIVNLLLMIVGSIIIAAYLSHVQTKAAEAKQKENNELALTEAITLLTKNSENTESLTQIFHEGNWKMLDDIGSIFSNGMMDKVMSSENEVRSEVFSTLISPAEVSYLYLLDLDGNIVVSPDPALVGRNPATTAHMTQDDLNRILANCRRDRTEVSPELVENQFGSYYFYSKYFTYGDKVYCLAMGIDSWLVDYRIDSMSEVSVVLSRMGVINDGFLFSINKKDNLFSYYKDGDTLLTGQDAFSTGLSEEVLTDGYNGEQTILGERYYCSSKVMGDDVVIVATARSEEINAHDKYVLFWSVLGFDLVMIICLAYAIILQNDYYRQGIETETSTWFKNTSHPLFFDKTIFSKVYPLMLIGVMAVFGISYYTQTLLAVTDGVDQAHVVLQEITGRYEENQESSKVIEDYYQSRFLSTAHLLAFYLEENPEVLNESSDFYHMTYGENGEREYILDDEGNPLKSVRNSQILQAICDENLIDSIYMYDQDGHVIATNTPNWYFVLSMDPAEQSYPFRDVLAGKTDYYLQPAMVDELGEESQYFGISLDYYTRKDENGDTEYVSRFDFEEACAAAGVSDVRSAGGITKHRSLLQIELNRDLVSRITAPTDVEAILSTRMLAGGSIVMFDNSPEHVCLYSPIRTSIGRTAEDLGVSPNAFNNEVYYGFNRVNGVRYFQLYRYVDKYFIATAIPDSVLFKGRTIIASITSVVSLILISLLMLTVTLTSEREDRVYEELVRDYNSGSINSPIFNILLPSGRLTSTVQAQTRWDNSRVPWKELSPEMKLGNIIGWLMGVPVLYFVISALGLNKAADEDSVIRYIIGGGWDHAPNVFAFSACFMVLAMTVIAINLFRIPVRWCTGLIGTRGETIGHLLLSIVKYGGTLGALFYCLYLLGVDSGNLLASAAISSLVIGLGAQSLIKDIIAGIFIVFEGEFRVGDIVTISGFRGTVTDIGLRTTKITGDGNVKIFNNSEISGVVNMTKETSVAATTISLSYNTDISYLDEVLARELPKLKEENKKILDGPENLGVSAVGDNSYSVTVIARCTERNVRDMNRYLNRALLDILFRNGIKKKN